MKEFKLKRTRSRVHHTQRYPLYATLVLILGLAVALTVVSLVKARADAKLEEGRKRLTEGVQYEVSEVLRAFEKKDLPTANLPNDILPAMRIHMYAADALNDLLAETFGESGAAIDLEAYARLEAAMTEVDRNLEKGESTGSALGQIATLLTQMEADLNARAAAGGQQMTRSLK